MKWLLSAVAVLSLFAPVVSSASPIVGLCNTGNTLGCGALVADGTPDPNYFVTGPQGGPGTIAVIDDGYPIGGAWIANSSTSKWIAPEGLDDNADAANGIYVYKTTFDLTGYDPSTASITGDWASDNDTRDILINGNSTGQTNPVAQFHALTPFFISGGFVAGLNTLEFRVFQDGDSPTGLRVDNMIGTAEREVPEPASLTLVGLGLVVATRLKRTRR